MQGTTVCDTLGLLSALSVAGWEKHRAEVCGSCSFQAISNAQRELIRTFQEPQ